MVYLGPREKVFHFPPLNLILVPPHTHHHCSLSSVLYQVENVLCMTWAFLFVWFLSSFLSLVLLSEEGVVFLHQLTSLIEL